MPTLHNLAVDLRVLQLMAQNAHHLTCGPTFFSDHEMLNKFYREYSDDYDTLVERWCLNGAIEQDLINVQQDAVEKLVKNVDARIKPTEFFRLLYQEETEYLSDLSFFSGDLTLGTKTLLGDLANRAEQRSYLYQQRTLI